MYSALTVPARFGAALRFRATRHLVAGTLARRSDIAGL
jgi:hypothetical protein